MMNKLLLLSGILLAGLTACKKDRDNPADSAAAIQVVNAVVGVTAIQVNTNNAPIVYATAPKINYGAAAFQYTERKSVPVTAVSTADTTTYLVNNSFSISGKIYSLYLIGQSPDIDTLFREETDMPFVKRDIMTTAADSIIYIRFVNLSPNSNPVNIRIQGASSDEAGTLPYKGTTSFKAYPAGTANPNYKFEIRDAGDNTLLLTYTFSLTTTNRFKNVSLVLRGLQGGTGTNALAVSAINYFQ